MDHRFGLGVDADHAALCEAVQGFVTRHLDEQTVRAGVENPATGRPDWWSALAEQGLLGLHLPERLGGQDAGLVGLAVALEVIGRTAAPGPTVPTMLASALLAAAAGGEVDDLVERMAGGDLAATIFLHDGLSARASDDGLVVSGTARPVLCPRSCEVLLARVEVDGAERWAVLPLDAEGVSVRDGSSIDVVRECDIVECREVAVPARRVVTVDPETVRTLSTVVLGAEAVGVASWSVQAAAEYATTREQFGRPIGQFQGVKHRCAQMAIALEQARATVWDAARAWDAGDDSAGYAAAVAALVAPDAAVSTTRDAIQVLGGIGYTWEHDAHLFYRRAVVLRGLLGTSRSCAAEIARRRLAGQSRPATFDLPAEAERMRPSIAADLDRLATLDEDTQLNALGDEGWAVPHLPRPFGRGAGPIEQLVIAEECARSGVVLPELGLATWILSSLTAHATEDQAERLVRPTLRGDLFWCQLFSEPGAGSDLASLRTAATRTEGGWLINGQKIWTSLGFLADRGALVARTDRDAPKHDGITYFALDMTSPGVTVRPLREASGGTLFSEVFLDDVFVPDDDVVGPVDGGWRVARGTLAGERVALGKGNPLWARPEEMVDLAARREGVDPVGTGRLLAEFQTMQLLNVRTVLAQVLGVESDTSTNIGKFVNMRVGQAMADFCHAELGLDGLTDADPATGRWVEQTLSSRAMTIYGGTSEIQLNVVGERLLGLPRDPVPATDAPRAPKS